MNKHTRLQQQAINAAKRQDWSQAIICNQEQLTNHPQDVGALNRLGVAYLQANQASLAKNTFHQVLELDKSNSIAKKHLQILKTKQVSRIPAFSHEQFIEEPGTTKIIELHRLANRLVLDRLNVGETCFLKPKNRYISVETAESNYVGALPEDLSFRLTKLIKRGNDYSCFIYATSTKSCNVYIKELKRSKRNQHINSFPITKNSLTAINDVDERSLLEDDIPVAIVKTDDDEEPSLEELEPETNEETVR